MKSPAFERQKVGNPAKSKGLSKGGRRSRGHGGQWSVGPHPELKKSKYGEYREAWELLRGPLPGMIARIEAVVEESPREEWPGQS